MSARQLGIKGAKPGRLKVGEDEPDSVQPKLQKSTTKNAGWGEQPQIQRKKTDKDEANPRRITMAKVFDAIDRSRFGGAQKQTLWRTPDNDDASRGPASPGLGLPSPGAGMALPEPSPGGGSRRTVVGQSYADRRSVSARGATLVERASASPRMQRPTTSPRKNLPSVAFFGLDVPLGDMMNRPNTPSAPSAPREAWGSRPVSRQGVERATSAASCRSAASTPDPFRSSNYGCSVGERVSCTTQQAVWSACDVFWSMDSRKTGSISRMCYIHRLRDPPSVERLRVLRRANLSVRFAQNAAPVCLEEMLQLMWPSVGAEDRKVIRRWVQLREAWHVVHRPNFRGERQDMEKTFNLLEGKAEGDEGEPARGEERFVAPMEVARAQIVTWEDIQTHNLTRGTEDRIGLREYKIDTWEWKERWWPALKAIYMSKDTIAKMKKEEEVAVTNDFHYGLRSGICASSAF